MNNNLPVRIGIIGCGGMGNMHRASCALNELAELVAVADADPDICQAKAKDWGAEAAPNYKALLERSDIDAVFITTPTPTHAELAVEALEHGKHTFVEKPMARTIEQAKTMVDAANRTDRISMVGQVIRFWPEYRVFREAVAENRYGQLRSLRLHRTGGCPTWGVNNWFTEGTQSGSAALDLHTHDTDFVVFLLGKPDAVHSHGSKDHTGWWSIITQYVYSDGPSVYAEGSWYYSEKFPFNMSFRAVFEEGVLDYDSGRDDTLLFYPKAGEPDKPRLPEIPKAQAEGINITDIGAYYLEDIHFFECIAKGQKPETATFQTSYEALQVVFSEIRSAEENKPVRIENLT